MRRVSSFGPFGAAVALSASFLYASPLSDGQASLKPIVESVRADYPTPMAPAQVGALVTRVVSAAGPDWGVLLKPAGNNCPSPVGFISCDIVVHIPTEQEYDILADSDGVGQPVFEKLPFPCGVPPSGCSMQRVVRVMAPVEPPPPVIPPAPPVDPPPAIDPALVAELVARVKALEAELAGLRADLRKPRPIELKGGWPIGTLRGTLGPPQ